jgi:hypothetical protein
VHKENVVIYTMECYPAIKKKEVMSFSGKWMELEMVFTDTSQTQKDKYCMLSLT